MTFTELRKQATAAETCLINTVITMVEKEVREKMLFKFWDFIKQNRVPSRENMAVDPEAYQRWFAQLERHMNPTSTDH
jgi:hypothetical protein